MKSQIKCNATTSANIQNTSGNRAKGKYTLSNLHQLTFNLEGVEETLNVEECTAEQFNLFAQAVAEVKDVDISVWPLEERRNLVNELWHFCQSEHFEFPLTDRNTEEGTPTSPLTDEAPADTVEPSEKEI